MARSDITMQKPAVRTKPPRVYTSLNQSYEERQQWYRTERWQRIREDYLQRHSQCVICMKKDTFTPAVIVDHVDGHDPETWKDTFWDGGNGGFQSLCWSCHSRKTTLEDQKRKPKRLSPSERAALVLKHWKG